jgi:hypothetical protein
MRTSLPRAPAAAGPAPRPALGRAHVRAHAARPQVLRAHKGFGRNSIAQLHVIRGRRLLLSLSGEGVHLHTLPDLLLKSQADRCAPAGAPAELPRRTPPPCRGAAVAARPPPSAPPLPLCPAQHARRQLLRLGRPACCPGRGLQAQGVVGAAAPRARRHGAAARRSISAPAPRPAVAGPLPLRHPPGRPPPAGPTWRAPPRR